MIPEQGEEKCKDEPGASCVAKEIKEGRYSTRKENTEEASNSKGLEQMRSSKPTMLLDFNS